jgi:hypothetical protein
MEALLSTKPLQHTHVILKFEFVMLVSPVWKIFVRSVFIISINKFLFIKYFSTFA